jgi:hypothetical protein
MMTETFIDSRLQVHWAAQAVAGVGRSLFPSQSDDSHSTLAWSRPHRAFAGSAFEDGTCAALRLRDLTLMLIRDRGLIEDEFPLRGRTIDDAFGFFEKRFGRGLRRPNDTESLPAPPPSAFDPAPDDLAKLDRLYDDADNVLQSYRSKREACSEVRCWPHHFDIATLQMLAGGGTLGAGFVAGDGQYREPYWYVTPYPYPNDRTSYPPLPLGFWNTEGWFGAVMLGDHTRGEAAEFLEVASGHFAPIVKTRLPA